MLLPVWIIICLTVFAAYIIDKIVRKYLRFKRRIILLDNIPGPTPELLWGNARQFPGLNEAGLKYQREQMAKNPKLSKGWIGPFVCMVQVNHPDTVKVILKSSEPKSRHIYGLIIDWLGEGLLISNGAKWHRNRHLLTPAFHFDILKQYMKINNEATNVLLNKLESFAQQDSYFEAFSEVSLFTLDVILQCAFSMKSDCQTIGTKHPYIQAVNELNHLMGERFFKFWLYPDFIYSLTSDGRRWKKACQFVHKVAEDIIEKRRNTLETDKVSQTKMKDFLAILLTAKDDNGIGMTPLEIRNEVDTFLFEGHDTTTSALSWALYMFASHPEAQEKMQKEIDDIFEGRESDEILWNDLPKLPYLTMCLKESMRINPPVLFIQRETTKPLVFDKWDVPAGTLINIPLYNVLNNHTVWENPLEFRPERFLQENLENMDTFSYVPFSAGPRNCIGQNFAMHEMKTVLARILRRYTLVEDPERKPERRLSAVMRAKNGIHLKAIPRRL